MDLVLQKKKQKKKEKKEVATNAREKNVYMAMLAEQTERYDEMAMYMEAVVKKPDELSAQERNMLSTAYENAVGSRRAAWRILRHEEQKESGKGNADEAAYAKEYQDNVEKELQNICDEILVILDGNLINKASTSESKTFYMKMKGDYFGYIAEFTRDDAKAKASEIARITYEEAMKEATRNLVVTDPIRLSLALNFAVFQHDVLNNPEDACKMARTAFNDGIGHLDRVAEDSYKETTTILQQLRDHLKLWTCEEEKGR